MGVKFLSQEWADAVEERLNQSESFRAAAAGRTLRLQQVVTSPEGETRHWFRLEDGLATLGLGDIEGPDATLRQDYETAAAISKGELSALAALMSGRLKVSGGLMKLMPLQALSAPLAEAVKGLDVEY